ncbi:MAG: sugar ABC transporter ATP-binding protein [Trueperaceae bacterium]|nr:sugar ABC transporter ATP-binding protein [Trueperaceae bacterium]
MTVAAPRDVPDTLDSILELKDITKTFPGVTALDQVSFDVRPGEIHALLGENGAGKSTLMKIMAGTYRPNGGTLLLEGEPVSFSNPLDAKQKGILLIHQELSLVPGLSVAENIFLGSLPTKALRRVDWAKLWRDASEILDALECTFGPKVKVSELSIANQQMVEIARALAFDPRVVVFDEPTSSLTDQEKTILFKNIRRLQDQGVAMVYISHRMDEIFELSDRITVLRDGKYRGTLYTSETNEDEVTKLMIGRFLDDYYERHDPDYGQEVLAVEKLGSAGLFEDVSFTLREGEVLGMYGLIGAGRSEVAEAIFGLRELSGGQIRLYGQPVTINSPTHAVKLGIGFVPEDRKTQGLVLNMNVRNNISLAKLDELTRLGLITTGEEHELYETYQNKLEIKTPGPKQKAVNLSGGNQQKIVIAKWLAMKPKLLILDEPTRGIDVGSKSEIHKLIGELAAQGYAVLVISSEMPEVMGVSHRILTMYSGRVTGEFDGNTVSEDDLINAATGLTQGANRPTSADPAPADPAPTDPAPADPTPAATLPGVSSDPTPPTASASTPASETAARADQTS